MQGYLILKLKDALTEKELWELVKLYEGIEGVDFCSHVIGPYDFVLTVRSKEESLDTITGKVERTATCEEILSLKVNDSFMKHRELKDLKILEELA